MLKACRLTMLVSFFLALSAAFPRMASAQDWIYRIQEGDTLWYVCLKYSSKRSCWTELGEYNEIKHGRGITPGTDIRIPMSWLIEVPIVGEVEGVLGEVLYDETSSGDPVPLVSGQKLLLGSRIIVKEGIAEITLGNNGALMLRANSELELRNLSSADSPSLSAEIELYRGELEAEVKPRSESRFEIHTPSAIAAVRGTGFRVSSLLEGAGATRSEVVTGKVFVEAGSSQIVPAGFGVIALKGETLGAPRALPAPPIFFAEEVRSPLPVIINWEADPEAKFWQLDMYAGETGTDLLESRRIAQSEYVLNDIDQGCYVVALRAIDAAGFNGLESRLPVCVIDQLSAPVGVKV